MNQTTQTVMLNGLEEIIEALLDDGYEPFKGFDIDADICHSNDCLECGHTGTIYHAFQRKEHGHITEHSYRAIAECNECGYSHEF